LLKPGAKVVDLGAAPGGWSQVAARRVRVRAGEGGGRVVAIDLLDTDPLPGVEFLQLDFLAADAPQRLEALLGGPADVVLSDMAANATGHRRTDHLKIMALAETAADFARAVLRPGGAFLAKVLQGGTEGELLASLKRDFATVKHVKPAASRSDSAELYVLATGFRGAAAAFTYIGPRGADGLSAVSLKIFAFRIAYDKPFISRASIIPCAGRPAQLGQACGWRVRPRPPG
jgi:23S rRNA (uridine2552-2'-O)-methyltransferase